MKRATRQDLAVERPTAEEASFWQDHELPPGRWERPRFSKEQTAVLHLRVSRSALRRLRAKAAAAGLPLSTYASALLLRNARS